jgi:SH3-like domain-containing protein
MSILRDSVQRPLLAALCLSAAVGSAMAADAPAKRQTPSGLDVPRYVTLKFAKVNARAGPGDDHRLLWVYRMRDLPLQVVAETAEWRRVCDPDGALAWVHKRTVDGHRSVLNKSARPVALRSSPRPGAEVSAYLQANAMASLVRCRKGWCRVKAGGASGWAPVGSLWGTSDTLQCR